MSDTTPVNAEPTAGSHLTVEDAGSTTHAGDLFRNDTTAAPAHPSDDRSDVRDTSRADTTADTTGAAVPVEAVATAPAATADIPSEPTAPSAPGAPEGPGAPSGGLGALAGDDSIAHVFDQTNGVLDRFDGDSDGTAASDLHSAAERADENPAFERFADTEVAAADGADDRRETGD